MPAPEPQTHARFSCNFVDLLFLPKLEGRTYARDGRLETSRDLRLE